MISDIELWNQIAAYQSGDTQGNQIKSKEIKSQLSMVVDRRNKVAHEGGMQPVTPRIPWPIHSSDLVVVRDFIGNLVIAIDALVARPNKK